MKINSQYIEEIAKTFVEIVVFILATLGFVFFILLSSFMTRNSVVIISDDKEVRSFVEEKLKGQKQTEGVSQLILCFGEKDE